MESRDKWLELSDEQLLKACAVQIYKSSGPGGQHRNKVSSAVRLVHKESGVSAHGDESRSQHENKHLALKRVRMNIACKIRCSLEENTPIPDIVGSCIFEPKKKSPQAVSSQKLDVGKRDRRFWAIAAVVLDILESNQGQLAPTAHRLGISTGNLSAFLTGERHLLDAVQKIRQKYDLKPLHN